MILHEVGDFADDGYDLMPLDVLEQSIKQNGHLPGIPSATEVAQNGLSLGETQAQLLRKIEEFALYLIDQNKKLAKMREQTSVNSLGAPTAVPHVGSAEGLMGYLNTVIVTAGAAVFGSSVTLAVVGLLWLRFRSRSPWRED